MRKRGLKRKNVSKTSSTDPKQKKVNILTHRPKSYYMERAAELPTLPAVEPNRTKAAGLNEVTVVLPKVMSFVFPLSLRLVVNDPILFWNF